MTAEYALRGLAMLAYNEGLHLISLPGLNKLTEKIQQRMNDANKNVALAAFDAL